MDLRVFFYDLPKSFWGTCTLDSVGQHFEGPVCHRVEAVRHSQGAFLLSVVIMQIANAQAWRTKTSTIYCHLFTNHYLNSAFIFELILVSAILYVPGLNTAFGTRSLKFLHWVPPLGMFITHILWAEITKIFIRNMKKPDGSPGFFYELFYY